MTQRQYMTKTPRRTEPRDGRHVLRWWMLRYWGTGGHVQYYRGLGSDARVLGTILTYFRHFAKGAAFLAEVDDHAGAALLRLLDSFFNAEEEEGATCTNVGAKDVTSVALSRMFS